MGCLQKMNKCSYIQQRISKPMCISGKGFGEYNFITTILGGIKLSVDNINKHRRVFESIIKNESQLRTNSITHIEQELTTQRHQMTHLRDEFLKRHISGDTYQELKIEVESNIYNNEVNLRDIVDEQSPLRKFLFDDVPLIGDVVEFFKQSNGMMKRNILRCIFSEKIYFDEKKCNHLLHQTD